MSPNTSSLPSALPLDIQQLVQALRLREYEQRAAGAQLPWAEQLQLQLDIQHLRALVQHRFWQEALQVMYGAAVGRKLGEHQVEVGMLLEHILVSYGLPAPGKSGWHATEPGTGWLRYGSPTGGSYFQVQAGRVTYARLGAGAQPNMLFELDLDLMS